jgi:hypothetical protein
MLTAPARSTSRVHELYRIATVKSADQVALEAGNSPSVIFKNYRELATEDQA